MVRLIASDLDGTLLQNGTKEISKEVVYYIKKLYEYGVVFAAAIARVSTMDNTFFKLFFIFLSIPLICTEDHPLLPRIHCTDAVFRVGKPPGCSF